ncbi:hypothetical protein ABZS66_28145 [Dactylosporangium sp. NPDC005572]|uniref:hypothetical protein n=1 Tax=Dactylosporangium sp. NPDC005572 TaxID=3156889 RepID=UPI0033A8990C
MVFTAVSSEEFRYAAATTPHQQAGRSDGVTAQAIDRQLVAGLTITDAGTRGNAHLMFFYVFLDVFHHGLTWAFTSMIASRGA